MMKNFTQVMNAAQEIPLARVAVAAAHDDAVLEAVRGAMELEIAKFTLVGDAAKINALASEMGINLAKLKIIDEPDNRKAALHAASLVSSGHDDILMKGLLSTADLLRAVLDKEVGLRSGRLLSHVFVIEAKGYDRLILMTDCAMNIKPSLEQKVEIIRNCGSLAKVLGKEPARVAALAAVEVVNPDMPATLDAAALAKMAERGQIKDFIIDGPLALDIAISIEAASHKGLTDSHAAGQADVLLVPNIEVGNVLAKSAVYFGGCRIAGLVLGASKPVVLTSRSDTFEAKILSIALANLVGNYEKNR
ncbi:MAG: pta 2 [Firmicutes bacterium]|nr:pta 2 [Bacillota bacterium]